MKNVFCSETNVKWFLIVIEMVVNYQYHENKVYGFWKTKGIWLGHLIKLCDAETESFLN